MKAAFVEKTHQCSNIYTFYFKPTFKLNFIPGQFIELTLPLETSEQRGNKRWFSLSSSPNEEYLAITTRIYPEISAFKKFLFGSKAGTIVDISQPMGDFVLPKDTTQELAFIAIGIGITPFRSIISHMRSENKPRNIKLIYANKNQDDFVFQDLMSNSTVDYTKHLGRFGLGDLKRYIPALGQKTIYLSGPERAVEKLYKDLLNDGIKQEKISVDYFHNYD